MTDIKERIAALRREQLRISEEIAGLYAACPHDWQPSDTADPLSAVPQCTRCGLRRDGWWCPTSPTKECDYTVVRAGCREYINYDCCRYCGNPSERK